MNNSLQQAIANHQRGDLKSAEAGYRQLIKGKIGAPEPYINLAVICHGDGRLEEAISLWRRAAKLLPDNSEIQLQLAAALKSAGKAEQCVKSYRKALSLDPDSLAAHYNLGNTLQSMNEHREAIDCYRAALVLKPDMAEAHYNLGNSLRTLGEQEQAGACYRQALALKPDYPEAYNNLGNVLRDQGQLNEAIDAYQQALAVQPEYPDAHYNLGNALFESGEFTEAIPFFDRSRIRDCEARSLFCCYRTGQFEEFGKRLPAVMAQPNTSPLVAALSGHYAINFDEQDRYNFCPGPLDFIYQGKIEALRGDRAPLRDALLNALNLTEISARKQGRLYNGMQSSGNLFARSEAPFRQLAKEVKKHFERYRDQFKGESCALIRQFPRKLQFESSWYLKMRQGGHLTSHIHETGWISGVLYLQLPSRPPSSDEGNIEFSLDGDNYPRRHENFPSKVIPVSVADIVLFPSSLFHRTIPFDSDEERICVAFDLSPG
jgi:uncharacterized protein (TIGR02466 family)